MQEEVLEAAEDSQEVRQFREAAVAVDNVDYNYVGTVDVHHLGSAGCIHCCGTRSQVDVSMINPVTKEQMSMLTGYVQNGRYNVCCGYKARAVGSSSFHAHL